MTSAPRYPGGTLTIRSPNENLQRLVDGLVPDRAVYAVYPGDGHFEPLPYGLNTLDFATKTMLKANGQQQDFRSNIDWQEVQSFVFATDSYISILTEPIQQDFIMRSGLIQINAKGVQRIKIFCYEALEFLMAAGTPQATMNTWLKGWAKYRYSDTTLTKTNGAGVADAYANVFFVPRIVTADGTIKTLNQAVNGENALIVAGYSDKLYIVRNVGSNDAQVRLQGGVYYGIGEQRGYVNDPDLGAGGGSAISVPASTSAVLRSATPFAILNLQARLDAGVGAGQTTQLIIESLANVNGGGGR